MAHERQVVEIPFPSNVQGTCHLIDEATGRCFPIQQSLQNPDKAFVLIEVHPFETLCLHLSDATGQRYDNSAVLSTIEQKTIVVQNGNFSLRLPMSGWSDGSTGIIPGPVLAFQHGNGPWHGRTYLDVRSTVKQIRGELVEDGPLRAIYCYRAELENGQWYSSQITIDAGQEFAECIEEFHAGCADQVVWDLSANDLPVKFYNLDSTAGYTTSSLFYYLDQRLARLAAWTQYSQQPGLSDGFACQLANDDVVGFVTLKGGNWRGNKQNHLEAWMRRWLPGDPASRSGIPGEMKADALPGPERIPLRGTPQCEAHFDIEGWLKEGRREFALVITTANRLSPAVNLPADPVRAQQLQKPLEHFEMQPDRERYHAQQCLLRKVHIQHGMMPLQDQMTMAFSWPEDHETSSFTFPNTVLENHASHLHSNGAAESHVQALLDYVQARVYGYWEGSGAAYTNCVVGRGIAPSMYIFHALVKQGALSENDIQLCRALFSFLCYLYESDNYYIGAATMMPLGDPEC
ncbi:MAG TPA: hypothetical protein VHV83_19955, partial [Armatimonadota bacterium]|nr:hypothetical protein [Armatimonadota bacterium]